VMIRPSSVIISKFSRMINADVAQRRAEHAMSQGINMNTDGLLLWEPDGDLAALEIWIGTPTGAEMIGAGMFGYWIAPING